MSHSYPFGALENQDAVQLAYGKTLYAIIALGDESYMETYMNISEIKQTDQSASLYFIGTCTGNLGWKYDKCFLRDHNIGAHYNNHYLFHDIEDAEAYLKYAKQYTSYPSRRSY